ncbi:MAG TPA: FMN-binding protein [Rhizomicrobium sp.]
MTAALRPRSGAEAVPVPVPKAKPVRRRPPSPYRDGEFAGNPADAEYGLIQVSVTIRDGAIAGVTFLQDPEDIDLSRQINQDAMPRLTREAIRTQGAQVDMVTGASFTTLAFRNSLRTALERAKGLEP